MIHVCACVQKKSQMDHEYEYEEEPYYFEEPIEVNDDDYWDVYYNPEG